MRAIPKTLLACFLALAAPCAALAAASAAQAQSPVAPGPRASGAVSAMPPADHASMPAKKKKPKTPPNSVKLVDLNRASTQELMTLPGIGQADAERIVAHRPYRVKSDLVNKKVLPTGPYLAVRQRVVALPPGPLPKAPKPPKAASAAKAPKA